MMKKILMLVLFMAPLSIFAQKFAHFNSDEILKVYPAYTTAMTELEAMGKKYETDLQEMQKELEAKVEKYRGKRLYSRQHRAAQAAGIAGTRCSHPPGL